MQFPPGNGSLQPVAIGAIAEVTKRLKPLMDRVALGDSASRQAVTRVNAEQASKHSMREPTRQRDEEGRRCESRQPATGVRGPAGVMATACLHKEA